MSRPVPEGVPAGALDGLSEAEYARLDFAKRWVQLRRTSGRNVETVWVTLDAPDLIERFEAEGWTVTENRRY